MTADFLGREQELHLLRSRIDAARGGLLLVVGAPRVGKQQLLRYLWSQLAEGGRYQLVPDDDTETEFLSIEPDTGVEEFKHAVAADHDLRPGSFTSARVVGIYGYQPSEGFHHWFVTRYVPTLGGTKDRRTLTSEPMPAVGEFGHATVPTTVVVAGFAHDLEPLRPIAVAEPVVLGPLEVKAVADHLAERTTTLADPLTDVELEAYATLVRSDAGLLNQLVRVLALDKTKDGR